MIAFLQGRIAWTEDDAIVLDVGGVGYRVFVPAPLVGRVQADTDMLLYTVQHVREDAMILFGFDTDAERILFLRLQSASGVGPRLALQMIGHLSAAVLIAALAHEDVVTLTKVPGVGAKTAGRLVLELRDRVQDLAGSFPTDAGMGVPGVSLRKDRSTQSVPASLRDLQDALLALGYSEREATGALLQVQDEISGVSVAEGVKRVLRELGRR